MQLLLSAGWSAGRNEPSCLRAFGRACGLGPCAPDCQSCIKEKLAESLTEK